MRIPAQHGGALTREKDILCLNTPRKVGPPAPAPPGGQAADLAGGGRRTDKVGEAEGEVLAKPRREVKATK